MLQRDVSAKIRERIEKKMARVRRRLEGLPSGEELMQQIRDVEVMLAQVRCPTGCESKLEDESMYLGRWRSLEVQREKLSAQMERLDLKRELIAEKRERLQGTLEELQDSLSQGEHDYVSPCGNAV